MKDNLKKLIAEYLWQKHTTHDEWNDGVVSGLKVALNFMVDELQHISCLESAEKLAERLAKSDNFGDCTEFKNAIYNSIDVTLKRFK